MFYNIFLIMKGWKVNNIEYNNVKFNNIKI